MSDQKSLHKTLEKLLLDATEFSIFLGKQKRYLWILVDIEEDDKYKGKGFTDNQIYTPDCDIVKCKLYPERYNIDQSICKLCFQDIYSSRYNSDDNSYRTTFNIHIRGEREEIEGLQDLIRKIEIGLIEAYRKSLYSYPNSLKNYPNPRLLMYFESETQDLYIIYREIEEGRIYFVQPPILREIGSKDKPIFSLIATYGKKENIPGDKVDDLTHLKFPKNFRFSFMVYEK
ncbi:MAG: hypothetical protein L7G90_03055 [Candidatus Nanopusillus sp.]|nr:hypothetical protein [Candidatus Nanopusillus sp.]